MVLLFAQFAPQIRRCPSASKALTVLFVRMWRTTFFKYTGASIGRITSGTRTTFSVFWRDIALLKTLYNALFFSFKRFTCGMCRVIRKKLKIFNSIIRRIFIYMMNYLRRFKVSSEMFLHYKTVFIKATIFICEGMGLHINNNISLRMATTFRPVKLFWYFNHNNIIPSSSMKSRKNAGTKIGEDNSIAICAVCS